MWVREALEHYKQSLLGNLVGAQSEDQNDDKNVNNTLKQLRPIGKGEQVLEKRLDQKELT
jgi:hypothetical protein